MTEATVTKVWNDNNNQDGKRPASLTVTLSNGQNVTLNAANNWTATVENLPKYANGVEIEYSWTEGEMPEGYTLTKTSVDGTITTLTNSYNTETMEVSVRKVWNDADNQDGIRPAELMVTLSNGMVVTLNEGNNWEASLTVPVYDNGAAINYTWSEETAAGYELTDTSVNGTITTLTNTHKPAETEATVTKVWDDNNNQDGKRPASLTVTLSNGSTVTLNAANNWTATVKNLPKYANGVEIEYSWSETVPAGYTLSSADKAGTVTTLTNKHEIEKTAVNGVKAWTDNNNEFGKRPAAITINLLANGTPTASKTVTAADNWAYSFSDLDRYAGGREITYTVTEEAVAGYTTTVNGTNVINTLVTYPVTYRYTGFVPAGAPEVPAGADYPADVTVTVAADPELRGYVFSGWTTSDATVTDGAFNMPAKPVELVGSWSTKALEISSSTRSWIYDGQYHTDEVYTVTYGGTTVFPVDENGKVFHLPTGDTLTIIPTTTGVRDVDPTYNQNNTFSYSLENAETYTDVTTHFGTLSIIPREVVVTIVGNTDTKVYNGSEQQVEGYNVTNISEPLYTVSDFSFSGDDTAKGTNVGTYPMGLAEDQYTNNNPNFSVTFDVTDGWLQITPKPVTVTAHDAEKKYNDPVPPLTADVDGAVNGDTVTYTLTTTANQTSPVGEYPITPSGSEVQGNYIVTYIPATLTVTPITVTVTAEDKTKVAGEPDPELTATVDGLVNGDTITYTISRDEGENPGSYPITPAGPTEQGNYIVVYVPGTLTITAPVADDREYTVTYVYIGTVPEGAPAVPEKKSYHVGDSVPAAEVPSMENYEFKGWNGEVSAMPADNVTVTGQWVPLTHTVIIKYVNILTGEEIIERVTLENLPVGESFYMENPEIEGYRLLGDEFVTGIIGNKDVMITVFYLPLSPAPAEPSEGGEEDEPGDEDSIPEPPYTLYQLVDIADFETPLGLGGLNINVGECIE